MGTCGKAGGAGAASRCGKEHAGRLLAAALALALATGAGAAGACPGAAHAKEYLGSVTIDVGDTQPMDFLAYRIFLADVAGAEAGLKHSGTATNLTWASEEAKNVVSTYIAEGDGYGRDGARDWLDEHPRAGRDWDPGNAQDAAEIISSIIAAEETDVDADTTPATPLGDGFAAGLARAIAQSELPCDEVESGTPYEAPAGLYLFVTRGDSGTAAIWVTIDSQDQTISAKLAAATCEKFIQEDSTGAWGKVADANAGQAISFKVVSTMPQNVRSYLEYRWSITDRPGTGLAPVVDENGVPIVELSANGKDITDQASVQMGKRDLYVTVPDLFEACEAVGTTLTKNTVVTLAYQAAIVPGDSCVIGSPGFESSAYCTHSANPVYLDRSSDTNAGATHAYTYLLGVKKVDKRTGMPLANARFSVVVSSMSSDESSSGLYVQGDGSLSKDEYLFTTDDNGEFTVRGIDEGTYYIREYSAPEGYARQDADVKLVVTSELDQDTGAFKRISAQVSGGEAAMDETEVATHLEPVGSLMAFGDLDKPYTLEDGVVCLTTSDDKRLTLPLTGLPGDAAFYLAAIALASIAIALHARRRLMRGHGRPSR